MAKGDPQKAQQQQHSPTLTEVLASSSDALLPPPDLLLLLVRLLLLGAGRTMALSGRWGTGVPGETGGEKAGAAALGAKGESISFYSHAGRTRNQLESDDVVCDFNSRPAQPVATRRQDSLEC